MFGGLVELLAGVIERCAESAERLGACVGR